MTPFPIRPGRTGWRSGLAARSLLRDAGLSGRLEKWQIAAAYAWRHRADFAALRIWDAPMPQPTGKPD
jgi:hypothetical protein